MSTLLALASDYIERMANPAFGIDANEDYAIKFGKLLESEGFEARLHNEIEALRDSETLSSYGWLWLFGWVKSTGAKLDQDLLLHLFHKWASPFVKAEIIQLATRDIQAEPEVDVRHNVFDFPNRFLAQIMTELVSSAERREHRHEHSLSTSAQSVLVAFLQAGSPSALAAVSVLLRHKWEGREELLRFFWILVENLDDETQHEWLKRLTPSRVQDDF